MSTSDALSQLEDQQGLLDGCAARHARGKWCGASSAAAFLQALDPALPDLERNPPALVFRPASGTRACAGRVRSRDADAEAEHELDVLGVQLELGAAARCAGAYVDESQAVTMIGSPANINATYGLMDSSGAQIRRCSRITG